MLNDPHMDRVAQIMTALAMRFCRVDGAYAVVVFDDVYPMRDGAKMGRIYANGVPAFMVYYQPVRYRADMMLV